MNPNNKDQKNISVGRGCEFTADPESGATARKGCYKLHSFNWTAGLEPGQNRIFEVRFKNTRKGFYENVNDLPLKEGDIVAVESSPGHDIGIVSLTGDMVARQMRSVGFDPRKFEFKKIYRKAKPYDIEKWQEAIALEHDTMIRSRQIAASLNLDMKIGDVEYQGDKIKAIFYYIADNRIDFRTLIKLLADEFKIRIEMKQIGARQEAGRIGGIGACGRELCCSTWVTNFVSVTTNSARYQDILLNPQKLAGQCGKLKCCLNFEVDSYIDARKDFPRLNHPLETLDASYTLVKTDILKREMTFSSDPGSMANLVTIPVERVKAVIAMNRKGNKPEHLSETDETVAVEETPDYRNVIGDDSITRFDKKEGEKPRRSRNRKNKAKKADSPAAGQPENGKKEQQPRGNRPAARKPESAPRKTENGTDENAPKKNNPPRRRQSPRKPADSAAPTEGNKPQHGLRPKDRRRRDRETSKDAKPAKPENGNKTE